MNTTEVKTGFTTFIIFLLGMGAGFFLDRPEIKTIESPIPQEKVQVVSQVMLDQIGACQDVIKLDEQGFNIASSILGLFPRVIDAVSQNNVAEIDRFTKEVLSYNYDISVLTAKKQAIIGNCID